MTHGNDRRAAKWTVVMLLIATGVIALAFTPWTRDVAALWWFVGLLLIIGAGVSSVVEARRSGRTPDSRNRWARITQVTAAFLVAALAGYWLTDVASPDSDDIAFSVPDEAPRVALAASRHLTVDLSEDAVKPAVEQWAASEKEFVDVPASTSSRLRNELMAADFRSTSGLSLDHSAVSTQRYRGSLVVSVPLVGTDVPEFSKVTFVKRGNTTDVYEMVAQMAGPDQVHFQMWRNGSAVEDLVITNPDPDAELGGVVQAGLSWSRLNYCLSNIGINWAVLAIISVVCAAACATMVGCAPCIAAMAGWTSGSIAGCVRWAWV